MRKRNASTSFPLTSTLIGAAIVLMLGYAGFVFYPFVSGPSLNAMLEPTSEGSLIISGVASRVSSLWVNDLPTPISDTGTFAVERTFPPGYTEVVVRAEDRFGRSRTETLTFVNTKFIHHAAKETSPEGDQEDLGETSEGDEGGEESSN